MIIGLDVYKSKNKNNIINGSDYTVSLFSFNNNGIIQNFDCYRHNNLNLITADIRNAVGCFISRNPNIEKIIIHYRKTLSGNDAEDLKDALIPEFLNHICQFSRMHWNSLKQQSLPVSTIYPMKLARLLRRLSCSLLPAFAKSNLWFL